MPGFKEHIIAGVILGVALFFIFRTPWVILVAALYSIMSDVDIATSIPFKIYAVATASYTIYLLLSVQSTVLIFEHEIPHRWFGIPPLLGLIILQFVNHREWLHSISAGLVFSIPLIFYLGFPGLISGLSGYCLHLLLDNELVDGFFT